MTTTSPSHTELEQLWAGEFGDAYLRRNIDAAAGRAAHWHDLLDRHPITGVLEVGCTQGDNLVHFTDHMPNEAMAGLDINPTVLEALEVNLPGIRAVQGVARDLPFADREFDLVFTVGLLIHIPDDTLREVMAELVRCSRRFVYAGEYHSDEPTTIRYRDRDGMLFKRDYGSLFQQWFPELRLVDGGYLTEDEGFDRVTWVMLERTD
ncbi:MAG: pseudaminic acid biosynthesis-associated methylase [Acidimicrobiales bacterium]